MNKTLCGIETALEGQDPALRHRVDGIENKVYYALLELVEVALDHGQVPGKVRFDPDILKDQFVPAQIYALAQKLVHIHGAEFEFRFARKGKQVGHNL